MLIMRLQGTAQWNLERLKRKSGPQEIRKLKALRRALTRALIAKHRARARCKALQRQCDDRLKVSPHPPPPNWIS